MNFVGSTYCFLIAVGDRERHLRWRFAAAVAGGWLALVGLLTFVYPASNRYSGRVVSISESAQLVVLRDGRPESLRLAEVEFPEKGQRHARDARAFANHLALGRDVLVEESRLQDGNRIGYVTLPGGRSLSAELVKAGLAWPSARHADPLSSSLAALEMRAMSARRGLWGGARITAPAALAVRRSTPAAGVPASERDDSAADDALGEAADSAAVDAGATALAEN